MKPTTTAAAAGLTPSEDLRAVAVTALFGGLLGMGISVIHNLSNRFTLGVFESWLKSALIGFLSGLIIACSAIAIYTLYMHARARYLSSHIESAVQQNLYASQALTRGAVALQQNQAQLAAAGGQAGKYYSALSTAALASGSPIIALG